MAGDQKVRAPPCASDEEGASFRVVPPRGPLPVSPQGFRTFLGILGPSEGVA